MTVNADADPASRALVSAIVERVRGVVHPSEGEFVPLHEPEFRGDEWEMVKDCLDSGWVSSVGKYVDRFEADVAAACDAAFGVAVVNGTAALEVAMRLVGVAPGDEVLVPSLTFIATANAAHHLGAIPHLVDSEARTLGMDPDALREHLAAIGERRDDGFYNTRTGRRISAMVPMHAFGHPVRLDALEAVSRDTGIPIVEDAAESLGSRYKGRRCGALSGIGAVSFNGNKIVTTGGGGAIVTNDEALARRAKHLTTTAKQPHPYHFIHDEIGYNYRMPNLNAALGVAQLGQLEGRVTRKRALAQRYIEALDGYEGLTVLREPEGCESNYWLNTLILPDAMAPLRDTLLEALNGAGIMSRPIWRPMHRLPIYDHAERAPLETVERLERTVINLPSSAHLAGRGAA